MLCDGISVPFSQSLFLPSRTYTISRKNRTVMYILAVLYVLVTSVSAPILQIRAKVQPVPQMQWFTNFFDRHST